MEYGFLIIILASIGAFLMAFSNGANDVANSFAPTIGSGALTLKQAVLIASVLNFVGAVLLGGNVAATLIEGVLHPTMFNSPNEYILAMFAALLGSAFFVLLSTLKAMPVSSSQSVVGSMMGVSIAAVGFRAVNWSMIVKIVASWFISVLLAGLMAYLLYRFIFRAIVKGGIQGIPRRLGLWLPIIISSCVSVLVYTLLACTRLDVFIRITYWETAIVAICFGLSVYIMSHLMVRELTRRMDDNVEAIEDPFKKLQVASASFVAFGHGSNDVANCISPVAAIFLVVETVSIPVHVAGTHMPLWTLALGGAGIAVGITFLGHKVMATLGERITRLNGAKGFSVNFATSATVVLASIFGMPVSTTHAATGSVMGTGLNEGIGNVNLRLLGSIVLTWLVTVPVAALFTAIIYLGLKPLLRIGV